MIKIELPFWLDGEQLGKLTAGARQWWDRAETWIAWPRTQLDPLTCAVPLLNLLAYQRDVQRFNGESELLFRKRVKFAYINNEDAGHKAGFVRIFERLGLGHLDQIERFDETNWDVIKLVLTDIQISENPELLMDIVMKYGRTCRRYTFFTEDPLPIGVPGFSVGHTYSYHTAMLAGGVTPPPPPPGDTQAPSVPNVLTATVVSLSQIDLTWSTSTDNVGVVGYKVYRGTHKIGFVGASMAMGVISGANALGSPRFWNPVPSYGGGGIYQWAINLVGGGGGNQSTTTADMSKFVLTGNPESSGGATWTYISTDGGVAYNLKGNLFKPAGSGPFPGVILSHGLGSTAPNGNQFRNAGLVTIGTNYTHSSNTAGLLPSGDQGASTANLQRAHKCWDILRQLGYVDTNRIAAHGHSMGAFVTAALVGTYPNDFKVASHTAGGVNDANVPWTKTAQAEGITIPYLMQHGDNDNTVPFEDDQALAAILTGNSVINNLIIYENLTHADMIDAVNHPEISAEVVDWFTTHGLFSATSNAYWSAFQNALNAQPTDKIWLQLASLATDEANETYANALIVVNEIKNRVPGVTVYVSAQPDYSPAHTCSIAGSTGPARMAALAAQLVDNGHCEEGPVIGPLLWPSQVQTDGCHANTAGELATGQQLIDFFNAASEKQIASVSGNSFSDAGLLPGVDYRYNVAAFDAAGNTSAQSATATVKTALSSNRPIGIYSIDTVVNKPFVSGVLVRTGWKNLETTQGNYNFSTIESKINLVPSNQKMSLVIFAVGSSVGTTPTRGVPDYVIAGSATWNAGEYGISPVPWDAFALARWDAFCEALSNHVYQGYALKDHPKIANIDCSIVGSQGIRLAVLPPGYSDALYKQGCLDSVTSMITRFPDKNCYVGLFGISGKTDVARDIRDTLLSMYDGVDSARINFFQENWTGKNPNYGSDQGRLVQEVSGETSIMLQACGEFANQASWSFCAWDASDNPQKAFDHVAEIGTTYVEVYVSDLNNASYQATFQAWHDALPTV